MSRKVRCLFLLIILHVPTLYALELNPEQVHWQSLEFTARKALISVDSIVQLRSVSSAELAEQLVVPPQGHLLKVNGEVIRLSTVSRFLGRKTDIQLWMQASDGQALQRERLNTGSKNRYKLYRYLSDSVYTVRRKPQDGEELKPSAQWSDKRSNYYPLDIPEEGMAITDSSALLYVVAAADLHAIGDSVQLPVFTDKRVSIVTAKVVEELSYEPSFERVGEDSETGSAATGNEKTRAGLVISLSAMSTSDQQLDKDFRLLGLKGVITVLLDQEDRVPVSVSGNADVLGRVTVTLQRLTLR